MKYDLLIGADSTNRKITALSARLGIDHYSGLVPVKLKGGENGWPVETLNKMERNGSILMTTVGGLIEAQKAVELETDQLGSLSTAYIAAVKKLRGELLNDVESVAKSTARLKTETGKALEYYKSTIDLWTSPQMNEAISNAERLAAALQSVNALQSSNITFAVLGKTKEK